MTQTLDIETEEIPAATPTEPAMQPDNNGSLQANSNRFRIPGDIIQRAARDLPEEQRVQILWFAGYCRARNLGREQIEKLLKKAGGTDYYSYDSIYQCLTGRRTGAGSTIAPMVKSIEAFRRTAEERDSQVKSGFVETRLYDLIYKRCRRALLRQRIGYIFGDSQIGKTESLLEYQRRHNHGETIYVEMPCGGSLGQFMIEMAAVLGMPLQQKQAELRRRIIEAFDDRMMLIVDEAHRALACRTGRKGIDTLDFLREIWNRKRCGMMLSMTNEGRDALLKGPHAKALQQLWRRRSEPLQLPSMPFPDDLERFACSYGLPPAADEKVSVRMDGGGQYQDNPLRLQNTVIREEGLGVWISILQDASDIAREQKRSITWGSVLKAYCLSQADIEEAA